MTFKPLLAARAEIDKLRFPLLASPKIDGIRCLTAHDGPVSRTMKPIPNRHAHRILSDLPAGLDGELVTFDRDGRIDDFNTIQSKIMSADGTPVFTFMVFDSFTSPLDPFRVRHAAADSICSLYQGMCRIVEHVSVPDMRVFDLTESAYVEAGWEGVMLRDPAGRYKHGRSTVNEQILLKVKRFEDDEGVITGFVERMHNTNEATVNALGHTERSSARAGLVGMGMLGAIRFEWNGLDCEVGTGFTDAQRSELWARRDALVGAAITFRYQGVGTNGRPRFPSFQGIRHDIG